MKRGLSWPQAFVIFGVIAGVVILAILRRDIASFVTLGVAVLAAIGLGAGQLSTIKDQVNGNLSRILDMFESHVKMLAAAHVPPSALPGAAAPAAEPAAPSEPPSTGGAAT